MRKTSLLFVCALALTAQQISTQRPGTLMNGTSTTMSNGVGIRVNYSTVVEPPEQVSNVHLPGGTSGNPQKVLHRYMVDQDHAQYFGYDLSVSRASAPGHFTVTISPLTLTPQEFGKPISGGDPNALRPVPLPTYPPPQDVQDGDTISLDLLVSADGKTKVVDYFQIWGVGENGPVSANSTGEPRDYTLDDGVPQFNFDNMKVSVNGQPAGTTGFTGRPGVTLWVAAPNQGRYILSLLPHEGFQKAGVMRDNVISFQSDGQQFELRGTDFVLGRRGAWNLYVMHDARYPSKPGSIAWGTDRMENLLPNQ